MGVEGETRWKRGGEVALQVYNGLLDLIYPPCCLVCGAWLEEGSLCQVCIRGFAPLPPPFCERCGAPVAGGDLHCETCARGRHPAYAWSSAMGHYSGTLRTAVHRLKYDGKTALAAPLARLLSRSLDALPSPLLTSDSSSDPVSFDRVVPVPLHPSRLRRRGFNQAERIAFHLARERGWTLDANGLYRVRRTPTQTALTAEARLHNVRDAFRARTSDHFSGMSVLLVDDVLTTSATVKEAARVIRDAGATRICVAALARG